MVYVLAPGVHSQGGRSALRETDTRNEEEGGIVMRTHVKSVVLGLALITLLTGLSACAKRPVVIGGSPAPAPSAAATSAPTR
jgi:hypothetical protein